MYALVESLKFLIMICEIFLLSPIHANIISQPKVISVYACLPALDSCTLSIFILDTGKQVLLQTVNTKMKFCIRQHFISVCTVC